MVACNRHMLDSRLALLAESDQSSSVNVVRNNRG